MMKTNSPFIFGWQFKFEYRRIIYNILVCLQKQPQTKRTNYTIWQLTTRLNTGV